MTMIKFFGLPNEDYNKETVGKGNLQ